MNTKTIKFDLNKFKLYEKIKAKQGDTKSRFLLFQLLDGSAPFNLKNRSVRAYMIKPDGKEIFNDLIVNNYNLGYCTLELTNQVLAVPGTLKIELMVTEEEKKLTSSVFELEVIKSINSEKSIVSTNEFTALLNGLAALSEYDNYKNAVKEMEINKADKAKVEEKFGKVYEQLDTMKIENSEEVIIRHKNITNKIQRKHIIKGNVAGDSIMISTGSSEYIKTWMWLLANKLYTLNYQGTVGDYLPLNVAVGGTNINNIIPSISVLLDADGKPIDSGIDVDYWIIGTARNDTMAKDIDGYKEKLRFICTQANKLEKDLIIVTAPPKFNNGEIVDSYEGEENYLIFRDAIIEICEELDISLVNLHQVLLNKKLNGEDIRNVYYSDDVHLNDAGNSLLCDLIFKCLSGVSVSNRFVNNNDNYNDYFVSYLTPFYLNNAKIETLSSIPENSRKLQLGLTNSIKISNGGEVHFKVPSFFVRRKFYISTLSKLSTGNYTISNYIDGNVIENVPTLQQHNSEYEYVKEVNPIADISRGRIIIKAVGGDVYLNGIVFLLPINSYKTSITDVERNGSWTLEYLTTEQFYKSNTVGNYFEFEWFGNGFEINLPHTPTGAKIKVETDGKDNGEFSLYTSGNAVNNFIGIYVGDVRLHKTRITIIENNGNNDLYIGKWIEVYSNNQTNSLIARTYGNGDIYDRVTNYNFIEGTQIEKRNNVITVKSAQLVKLLKV